MARSSHAHRDRASLAWGIAFALPLAWDAYLIRHGHTSLSEHVRHHPMVACCCGGYLFAHFLGHPRVAAHLDPLAAMARRLTLLSERLS
jgi:hypothetical protein